MTPTAGVKIAFFPHLLFHLNRPQVIICYFNVKFISEIAVA